MKKTNNPSKIWHIELNRDYQKLKQKSLRNSKKKKVFNSFNHQRNVKNDYL